MLAQLEKDYPEDFRHVFRHYPLIGTPEQPFHDKAALSAQATEAAGLQGNFWEMHDLLFERQGEWATLTVDQFQEWLSARADELDLDVEQFEQDLTSEELAAEAQAAWDKGNEVGLPGTPFLVINGSPWPDNIPLDYNNLKVIIELTRIEERQFTTCPEMTIDPAKMYVATLNTTKGDIELELFPDVAPMAVNSFVFLAREGWFDGVMFHRVLPGFVAQAGDPTGTGYGGPGYAFDIEVTPDLIFDQAGLLAMANAGPSSNGSQFFITYDALPNLDGGYTIFGRVVSGMDVAEALIPRDPSQPGELPQGDIINSVTIKER